MADTNRTISGQVLPKQARTGGMPVPSILNPDPMMLEPVLTSLKNVGKSVPTKKKTKTRRSKRITNKNEDVELVGKYHMLSDLARAPCNLTFGQLIRSDADEAQREIRRLFSSKIGRSILAQVVSLPRRLNVVSVRVYGIETQALLDSEAIPNLMSDRLADLLSLSPEATTKTITVAGGTAAKVHGTVGKVPVSFAGLKDQLGFLAV